MPPQDPAKTPLRLSGVAFAGTLQHVLGAVFPPSPLPNPQLQGLFTISFIDNQYRLFNCEQKGSFRNNLKPSSLKPSSVQLYATDMDEHYL